MDKEDQGELRTFPEERYKAETGEKHLLKGMNKREVIKVWGFFKDQNIYRPDESKNTVYEQLIFPESRQVYLKNGLVCFWSE